MAVSCQKYFFIIFCQAYDETGDVFPIWAECLGFELIALIVGGRELKFGQYDQSFLSLTDARNISLKLILSPGNSNPNGKDMKWHASNWSGNIVLKGYLVAYLVTSALMACS